MNLKQDLRVQKTQEAIRGTFRQMIIEMDFQNITIKELAERARINRKTFYFHFSKLDDLLEELCNELVEGFLKRVEGYRALKDRAWYVREFFINQEELGGLGERIVCAESNRYMLKRMTNEIVSQTWDFPAGSDDLATYRQNILVSFSHHCILGAYRQWIKDDKKIPLEDMIELTITLVSSGTNGFFALCRND